MTTPPHGYTVDLALLDQTTERIAQYVRSLTDTMAGIDADVTQRCAAVWGGEGSAAYQERQARWNAAIARANGEVEEDAVGGADRARQLFVGEIDQHLDARTLMAETIRPQNYYDAANSVLTVAAAVSKIHTDTMAALMTPARWPEQTTPEQNSPKRTTRKPQRSNRWAATSVPRSIITAES